MEAHIRRVFRIPTTVNRVSICRLEHHHKEFQLQKKRTVVYQRERYSSNGVDTEPSGIVDQRPESEVPTRLMGPASLEVPLAAVERRRRRSEGQDPARVREAQEADS